MIAFDAAARFSCVIWASVLASVLNFMLSLERLSELALDAKHFADKQRSQTNMIDD